MKTSKNKAAPLAGLAASKGLSVGFNRSADTAEAQRARLLQALSRRAVTTLDARSLLDVMHPAARVMELRRAGHQIQTIRVTQQTACGALHSVARYVLVPARRRAKQGAA